ncbi:hypothetical protein EV560_108117 [Bosea sp. BK604]|nr:hypothetical protein EV560_108117 [Bosea sp. BK604]
MTGSNSSCSSVLRGNLLDGALICKLVNVTDKSQVNVAMRRYSQHKLAAVLQDISEFVRKFLGIDPAEITE